MNKNTVKKNDSYIDHVNDDTLSIFLDKMKFEIRSCGRWVSNISSSIQNFIIHAYELLYIVEGGTYITKNGVTYEALPGSVIFLEPNTIFSASTKESVTTSYYYIHFEIYPIYRIYELFRLLHFEEGPVIYKDKNFELLPIFRQAVDESLSQNPGYKSIISFILNYILVRIIRSDTFDNTLIHNVDKASISDSSIIDNATKYIAENLDLNLKVSSVAEYVNISENYLYKLFMKLLGISPSKYITDCKINRSIQLLQTGNYSIKQISADLGFSSPYHFSNTFKSHSGISPSKYIQDYNRIIRK